MPYCAPADPATILEGRVASFDGSVLAELAVAVAVPARGATTLALPPGIAAPGQASRELQLARADPVAPDAVVDDMLATLLPAETAHFIMCTAAALDVEQVADPLVLRSADQLLAAPMTATLL